MAVEDEEAGDGVVDMVNRLPTMVAEVADTEVEWVADTMTAVMEVREYSIYIFLNLANHAFVERDDL